MGTANANSAIDVTIDDDRVNSILNIFPGRHLQIYTTGGEYYIPLSQDTPIAPTNIVLYKSTQHGSKTVPPVSVDGATLFLEGSGSVLREFVFNQNEQSYVANNVSLLASGILNAPTAMVSRASTGTSPASYVYVVNSDGSIAVLNIARDKELFAWSSFSTQGIVEDITNVNGVIYLSVVRTINGATRRHIEKLDGEYFMDSSKLQTSVTAKTTWSGLTHLEAETVKVRGDEYILSDEVISFGSIETREAVSKLEVGFNFNALMKSVPLDKILQNAPEMTGEHKRLIKLMIRLYSSRNIKILVGNKSYVPFFRSFGSYVLDQPVQNYSGWKQVFLTGQARDAQIIVTQTEPVEFNVLAWKVTIK